MQINALLYTSNHLEPALPWTINETVMQQVHLKPTNY